MFHQPPFSAANPPAPLSRRAALGYLGATAGAATLALAGCTKDTENNPVGTVRNEITLNISSGDTGLLQYLYALEQLVASFYTQATVNNSILNSIVGEPEALREPNAFQSINRHRTIYRDLLKSIILQDATAAPIRLLTINFTSIDFTKRVATNSTDKPGVLQAAKIFADLSVAAYNGVGHLLTKADYLLLISKMASVNARHAAYIRDRLYPGNATLSFAGDDQVDPVTGLDRASAPADVVTAMQLFIANQLVLS